MIPLLTMLPQGAQAVAFPAQTAYVVQGLKRNVQTALDHWRTNYKAAKTNQFLVRLLDSLAVPMSLPLKRYYDAIDAKALTLSMAMRMTSSLYKGHEFSGVFYSAPTVEYMLALDTPIDADDIHARWQDVEAVKVLCHPKSDLHCVLPCGENYSVEEGLAVIQIHIPALAIQYRAFCLANQGDPNGEETTQMFIERHVLPNMLPSQTEVAFFNRLCLKIHGQSTHLPVNSLGKSPFPMPFPVSAVDHVLDQVLEIYPSVDPTFEKLLRNTPALYKTDQLEAQQLPHLAMTSQVEWLLIAARLKVFDTLIKLGGQRTLAHNGLEINQLMRCFRDPAVTPQLDRISRDAGKAIALYRDNVLTASRLSAT